MKIKKQPTEQTMLCRLSIITYTVLHHSFQFLPRQNNCQKERKRLRHRPGPEDAGQPENFCQNQHGGDIENHLLCQRYHCGFYRMPDCLEQRPGAELHPAEEICQEINAETFHRKFLIQCRFRPENANKLQLQQRMSLFTYLIDFFILLVNKRRHFFRLLSFKSPVYKEWQRPSQKGGDCQQDT